MAMIVSDDEEGSSLYRPENPIQYSDENASQYLTSSTTLIRHAGAGSVSSTSSLSKLNKNNQGRYLYVSEDKECLESLKQFQVLLCRYCINYTASTGICLDI
jgi:hypothetical protein